MFDFQIYFIVLFLFVNKTGYPYPRQHGVPTHTDTPIVIQPQIVAVEVEADARRARLIYGFVIFVFFIILFSLIIRFAVIASI